MNMHKCDIVFWVYDDIDKSSGLYNNYDTPIISTFLEAAGGIFVMYIVCHYTHIKAIIFIKSVQV